MYEKIESLLEAIVDTDYKTSLAAQKKVLKLISNHGVINAKNSEGMSLLHLFADMYQYSSMFLYSLALDLRTRGAEFAGDKNGVTPIHLLAYYTSSFAGKETLMNYMVSVASPDEINAYDAYGKTALHEAIEQNNIAAFRILLSHPYVNVNLRTKKATNECNVFYIPVAATPIEAAILLNRTEMIAELLLRDDLDIVVEEQDRDNHHFSDRFPKLKVNLGCISGTLLHLAAALNDVATCTKLIGKYGQKALLLNGGRLFTPLHSACLSGSTDIVAIFLDRLMLNSLCTDKNKRVNAPEYYSFVNSLSEGHNSALGLALNHSRHNLDDIFEIFINRSIFDVNQPMSMAGYNLLHILVNNGDYKKLRLLIETCRTRLDFGRRNQKGQTVLRFAFDADNMEMVEFLAEMADEYGIDLDINESGEDMSPVLAILANFFEENPFDCSFRDISTGAGITTEDLLGIYQTGKSKIFSLQFSIDQPTITMDVTTSLPAEKQAQIGNYIKHAVLLEYNLNMGCKWVLYYFKQFINPEILDQALFDLIKSKIAPQVYEQLTSEHPTDRHITLIIDDFTINFTTTYVSVDVSAVGELEYEDIISYLGDKFDYKSSGKTCLHQMTNKPLLILLIKEGLGSGNFGKLKSFLAFDNIDCRVTDEEGNDFTKLLPTIHPMRIKIEDYIKVQTAQSQAASYKASTSSTFSLGGV